MTDDWLALNRANWNERVPVHLAARRDDTAPLRDGHGRLDALAEGALAAASLGGLAGLRVLHLQCHCGWDSLVLAGRGAQVTGVDFSPPAVEAAQRLAAELSLPARFVLANLYDAPAALPEPASFDLVFTTWGTTTWLPDIMGWARVAAGFLRPGGRLLFLDAHPAALVFDDMAPGLDGRPGWFAPYDDAVPVVMDDPTDYVDPAARLSNSRQVGWVHPVGKVLDALRGAGLRLDRLEEHPRIAWRMFRCLVQDGDSLWGWPDNPWLPLSLGLHATKET